MTQQKNGTSWKPNRKFFWPRDSHQENLSSRDDDVVVDVVVVDAVVSVVFYVDRIDVLALV